MKYKEDGISCIPDLQQLTNHFLTALYMLLGIIVTTEGKQPYLQWFI